MLNIASQDQLVRHSFVQVNESFVHLAQYGYGESIIRSPSMNRGLNNSLGSSVSTITSKSRSNLSSSCNSDLLTEETASKKLIIFIPGNPGFLGVYHDFLKALSHMICTPSNKSSSPIILAISHNNFDHPDHTKYRAEERICVDENDLNFVERALAQNHRNEPHHVELQVLNKLIILKKLLKIDIEDCRIMFIGHSVGCYFILRLLQDRLLASAHEGSVMIHPALENIGSTEKGLVFQRLFNFRFDLVMRTMAMFIDNLLPRSVKLTLTKWYCSQDFVQGSSDTVVESIMQLTCQKTLYAMVQLAKSEFSTIRDINTDLLIKPHVSKLKLIYALNDHWVHSDNRLGLKRLYPDLYMEEQSTLHAFVMDPQTAMDYAVKVGMFVQDFIDNFDPQ